MAVLLPYWLTKLKKWYAFHDLWPLSIRQVCLRLTKLISCTSLRNWCFQKCFWINSIPFHYFQCYEINLRLHFHTYIESIVVFFVLRLHSIKVVVKYLKEFGKVRRQASQHTISDFAANNSILLKMFGENIQTVCNKSMNNYLDLSLLKGVHMMRSANVEETFKF